MEKVLGILLSGRNQSTVLPSVPPLRVEKERESGGFGVEERHTQRVYLGRCWNWIALDERRTRWVCGCGVERADGV